MVCSISFGTKRKKGNEFTSRLHFIRAGKVSMVPRKQKNRKAGHRRAQKKPRIFWDISPPGLVQKSSGNCLSGLFSYTLNLSVRIGLFRPWRRRKRVDSSSDPGSNQRGQFGNRHCKRQKHNSGSRKQIFSESAVSFPSDTSNPAFCTARLTARPKRG